MVKKEKATTITGLPRNTNAALCYVGAWLTGLIFLILEKEDKFIRFHAMQSLVTFGGLTVLAMLPIVGWILSPFIILAGFVLWLACVVKAYQGEEFKLPIVGDFAKKQLEKMGK